VGLPRKRTVEPWSLLSLLHPEHGVEGFAIPCVSTMICYPTPNQRNGSINHELIPTKLEIKINLYHLNILGIWYSNRKMTNTSSMNLWNFVSHMKTCSPLSDMWSSIFLLLPCGIVSRIFPFCSRIQPSYSNLGLGSVSREKEK
jgi:hypothetical protein